MVTLQDAKSVTADLAKRFNPVFIFIFGSVARNGAGNDLDMLIVVDDAKNDINETNRKIQVYLIPYFNHFSIDPFIVGLTAARKRLQNGSPFLDSILHEGVLMYMTDAFETWNKNATEDLAMARYLLSGGFYGGSCYHAQQAVEKFIKMLLLQKGWTLEKTHTIQRLMALSKEYGIPAVLEQDEILFLDSIYRSRYPAEAGLLPQGEPGKKDAEFAICSAEKVAKGIRG
jgi:HEPN domain-containing protein